MDFALHRPTHLSDITLRLPSQKGQLLRGVQANPQEVQDFLVILLQVHHNLPQVIPIRQIVHPEQAVAKEIIKLSATDLPEGWAAHAVRHDVAVSGREVFHGRVAAEALIPALPAHPALFFAVIPVDHGLNRKAACKPYIAVISCADAGTEHVVAAYLKAHTDKALIKSKSAQKGCIELSYEVTLKQDNTGFITELSELDGVSSAVLVSYNGDYMG